MVAVASKIARGDSPSTSWPLLPSVLPNVSSEAWTQFVRVLSTQALGNVSESNGLGCFEMRPKRLAEIGLMTNLWNTRRGKRQITEGEFVLPLTREKFLANPIAQYNAFGKSIESYDQGLDLARLPQGVDRSGALAILHRAGIGGLKSWEKSKFPQTLALFEKARGIF